MPTSRSDPKQVVKDIEQRSREVSDLADGLSRHILRTEGWLNGLPGRVEAYHWECIGDEQNESAGFGLRLARAGKRWALLCAYSDMADDQTPVEWQQLSEASLDTKVRAIRLFPKLLGKIREAQDNRVAELKGVHEDFEAFAKAVGIDEGGN